MKPLLLLLPCAALIFSCGHNREDESSAANAWTGWHDILQGKKTIKNVPEIVVEENSNEYAIVTAKNVGKISLKFSGYSEDTLQTFHEIWNNDKWQDGPWNWCGTGLSDQLILPEKSVKMKVFIRLIVHANVST
jgi:hypothetical protein